MKIVIRLALVGALLLPTTGCGIFGDIFGIFGPNQTRVRLVNTNTTLPVSGTLFYGDDQNALEAILTSEGTERQFTLAAGETQEFSVNCEELQAIIIDDADLQVIGNIGPSQRSDVFRDGDDFNCGDTITFTFSGSLIPPELNINFTASSN